MSSFLDFIDTYLPGGTEAIPSWLAALSVKRPSTNLANAAPYYQMLAEQAQQANQFASEQAALRGPAVAGQLTRAQGVGRGADLDEAADRQGAQFQQAFGARRASALRSMAGVNPNSGAAQARLSALDASYAPGLVHALNTGRTQREMYGDTLRQQAIGNLSPNFGTGATIAAMGGAGTANLADLQSKAYRQEVTDATAAFMPKPKYTSPTGRSDEDTIAEMLRRFPVGTSTPPYVPAQRQ